MGSVDRACFGLFEMMIFRLLHNPLPLSFKPMNPNESAVVVSFAFFGTSLSSSRKAPLGTHKIAISRRRQSFKCNLGEAPSQAWLADWLMDKQFLRNQSIIAPSWKYPKSGEEERMMILGFLRILMIDDCLILLLRQSLYSFMSKVIAS